MSTYIRTVYQVVFSTKYRCPTLRGRDHRERLFQFIGRLIKNKRCIMYQAGGVEDHVHIVFGLHPSVALSSLVKDIKLATSAFIKQEKCFPHFDYWQEGYAAFTYTPDALPNLMAYLQRQEAHHRKELSVEELRHLLNKHGIPFDENYFA